MELLRARYKFQNPLYEEMAQTAHEIGAEMVVGLLTNPKGAGYYDASLFGNVHYQFEIDSAVSGNTPVGTVMEIENFAGPGTSNPPTVPLVQPSSTTADNRLVGVVTGGQTVGVTTSIAPGSIATVCHSGICQVLCDATTTAGSALIQSAATAGAAKTGAAVLLQTLGVALQAVTISSGTALVWCLVKLV